MSDGPAAAAPARVASPAPRPTPDPAATAREFEGVFAGQLAAMMMATVDIGDEFSGGHGEELFRGVLAEHVGAEIARRGGIGLAPMVLEQILKLQEAAADGK